jgi:hypothetical protein
VETANGEVTVTHRCKVYVQELALYIWAFLHVDTVCVLSLGMLVDRNGFTYIWKPGQAPELRKGKFCLACHPHFNVPFIFASKAKGAPSARTPNFEQLVSEEMQGLEDLIPTSGEGESPAQKVTDEIPKARGRPRERRQRG